MRKCANSKFIGLVCQRCCCVEWVELNGTYECYHKHVYLLIGLLALWSAVHMHKPMPKFRRLTLAAWTVTKRHALLSFVNNRQSTLPSVHTCYACLHNITHLQTYASERHTVSTTNCNLVSVTKFNTVASHIRESELIQTTIVADVMIQRPSFSNVWAVHTRLQCL